MVDNVDVVPAVVADAYWGAVYMVVVIGAVFTAVVTGVAVGGIGVAGVDVGVDT